MNTQETFNLTKLRCEVAMQQALKCWQPQPRSEGIECPRCESRRIIKHGTPRNKQQYLCNDCCRTFHERSKIECHCLIPGKQPCCQDCPKFKLFLDLVKQNVDALRELSQQELLCLLEPNSSASSDK